MKNVGLGLEALIPSKKSKSLPFSFPGSRKTTPFFKKESIFLIEVDRIKPSSNQPRREFSEDELKSLADSIKEFGILQPLIVTKIEEESASGTKVEYQLIAGERRWRAAKLVGMATVPVVVRSLNDQARFEVSLVENIQREDLGALEKAEAFKKLVNEFNLSQRDIAERIGKSRELVSNTIRLLELPPDIKQLLLGKKITEGHARALVGVENEKVRRSILEKILREQLNVRQVEWLARKTKKPRLGGQKKRTEDFTEWEEKLKNVLGINVRVRSRVGGYTLEFKNRKDLEAFISKL